jgi:tetratricopeptide (TPR) repeat protein
MYLQRIVEHLRGRPLHEIMQEEIIEPLGMEDSCMIWQEQYAEQAAVGHDTFSETSGRHRRRRYAHSAASLYTTARDYALFVAAVMNEDGLKSEAAAEMLTPQIDVAEDVFWSLGFGLEDNAAGRAFWQWGDYGIFRNYITAYKEQGIGVVYLTNSFNGLSIGPELVRLAIGGGEPPSLAHLGYPRYDSPAVRLARAAGEEGIEEARRMYLQIRGDSPEDLSEQDVNGAGYTLLGARKLPEAIAVFLWNVEAYPLSANARDSLAEAYMESGDTENAVKYYEQVLEMIPRDPRPDRDFLENLAQGARDRLARLKR